MKNLLAILMTGMVLVGCNNSDGDMYLGKWVNVKIPDISLEVTKHEGGNGYTITRYYKQRVLESFAGMADGKTLVLSSVAGAIPMEMEGSQLSVPLVGNCYESSCVLWNKASD